MSEDNTNTSEPAPEPQKNQAGNLLGEVADKISKSGPQIRDQVVNLLVQREVDARADFLEKGLNKRSELLKDLRKKEKGDLQAYDSDGKVVRVDFSKAAFDELKKAREQLSKLDNAIDKALMDNDYSKLKEILNSK